MGGDRQWGQFQPITLEIRQSVIRLLKQDPEDVPMRLIARRLAVSYSTVRQINNQEQIRPKSGR